MSSPPPFNPDRGRDENRLFTISGVTPEVKIQLSEAIQKLGQRGYLVECPFDAPPPKNITHCIVGDRPRSVKSLSALVGGMWIVTADYILDSLKSGFWRDEERHGCLRCLPKPLYKRDVVLRIPQEDVYRRMCEVVEYGEGRVVDHGDSTMLILSSGEDLLDFCQRHIEG